MKKSILLLLSSVWFGGFVFAADSTGVKPFKRYYMGVSFTGNITHRHLVQDHVPAGSTQAIEKVIFDGRNNNERPDFGYQLGIRFGVRPARWLGIETGVDYNRHRYRGNVKSVLGEIRTIHNYHYLNVPVALNFSLGKRKLRGLIATGVNFNFLVDRNFRTRIYLNGNELSSTFTTNPSSFNRFNVTPFLGIGVEWHIAKSLFLRLMPIAQMQALKNSDAGITEYLWSAGVNASLYFAFKKVK